MCRFVALISREDIEIQEFLDFLKLQAQKGKRSPHPDGFGIWLKSNEGEYLYKSTIPIWKENYLTLPKAHIAFLHARKRGKSGAPVSLLNLHPFIHKDSIFMHNGILTIDKHQNAIGDTDTESFFITLIERGLTEGLKYIVENLNFESLNFVMYRNNYMYIFRLANKLQNYFTIYLKKTSSHIIISTEKNDNSGWFEVNNGELIKISPELDIERSCIFQDRCH